MAIQNRIIEEMQIQLVTETTIPDIRIRPESPDSNLYRQFKMLREVIRTNSAEKTLQENLDSICRHTCAILNVDAAVIALKVPGSDELTIRSMAGSIAARYLGYKIIEAKGLSGYVIPTDFEMVQDLLVPDTRFAHSIDAWVERQGFTAALAQPLSEESAEHGVLYVFKRSHFGFSRLELLFLEMIADLAVVDVLHKQAVTTAVQAKRLFEDMLNYLPDPTLIIDTDRRIIAWNRAIEEMTGVPARDMMNKSEYEYAIPFYGKRRPMLIDFVLGEPMNLETDYDMIHQTRHSIMARTRAPLRIHQTECLWCKATPLYNDEGQVVGAIKTIGDVSEIKRHETALKKTNKHLKRLLDKTVHTLAIIGEKRDPYTAGHQRRVALLATAIARQMKLTADQIDKIKIAAMLHDIGKIYLPIDILNKPTRLCDAEKQLVKMHSQAGYEIVKTIPFDHTIADAVLQHHEYLDGSGYPNGLSSKRICQAARIITVADVVEAMASHRPYRPAVGINQALIYLEQNAGRLFDEQVVTACIRVFQKGFQLPAATLT